MLRESPTTNGEEIVLMPSGAKVEIIEKTNTQDTFDGNTNYWYKVKYGNMEGYCFGGFTSVEGNTIDKIQKAQSAQTTADEAIQNAQQTPDKAIYKANGKVYFYNYASYGSKRADYIVEGQKPTSLYKSGNFVYVTFTYNGITTKGYMPIAELEFIAPVD